MKIIGVIGTKGGGGKTTLSRMVADWLINPEEDPARKSYRVLLIDNDYGQASIADAMGERITNVPTGNIETALRAASFDSAICTTNHKRLDVVLSTNDVMQSKRVNDFFMENAEHVLHLHWALENLTNMYDVVIIDTKGEASPALQAVFKAATSLITPIVPQVLDIAGALKGTFQLVRGYYPKSYRDESPFPVPQDTLLGKPVAPLHIVCNRFDARAVSNAEGLALLRSIENQEEQPSPTLHFELGEGAQAIHGSVVSQPIPSLNLFNQAHIAQTPVHLHPHASFDASKVLREIESRIIE